jgi:hypothetical protein
MKLYNHLEIVSDDNQPPTEQFRFKNYTSISVRLKCHAHDSYANPLGMIFNPRRFFIIFNLFIYPLVHGSLLNGLRVLLRVIFGDHFIYTTLPLCSALVFHKLVFSRTCQKKRYKIKLSSQMLPSK